MTAGDKLRNDMSIKRLPVLCQCQIIEEVRSDPKFKHYISELLKESDPFAAILTSQRKAILNELNPENNPEMVGLWKVLRGYVRKNHGNLRGIGQVADEIEGEYGLSVLKGKKANINEIKKEQKEAEKSADERIKDSKKMKIDILRLWGYIGIPMGLYAFLKEMQK